MHQALAGSVVPARRAAAALLLELAQQTPGLAEACVCGGGAAALVEYLRLERGLAGWGPGLLVAGGLRCARSAAAGQGRGAGCVRGTRQEGGVGVGGR
jgi:hypothetical protein